MPLISNFLHCLNFATNNDQYLLSKKQNENSRICLHFDEVIIKYILKILISKKYKIQKNFKNVL